MKKWTKEKMLDAFIFLTLRIIVGTFEKNMNEVETKLEYSD